MKKILSFLFCLLLLANTAGAQGLTDDSQSAYLDSLYAIVFDRLVQTGSIMPNGKETSRTSMKVPPVSIVRPGC